MCSASSVLLSLPGSEVLLQLEISGWSLQQGWGNQALCSLVWPWLVLNWRAVVPRQFSTAPLPRPAVTGDWLASPNAFWEVLGSLRCALQAWEAQRLVCPGCMTFLPGFGEYIAYSLSLWDWAGRTVSDGDPAELVWCLADSRPGRMVQPLRESGTPGYVLLAFVCR